MKTKAESGPFGTRRRRVQGRILLRTNSECRQSCRAKNPIASRPSYHLPQTRSCTFISRDSRPCSHVVSESSVLYFSRYRGIVMGLAFRDVTHELFFGSFDPCTWTIVFEHPSQGFSHHRDIVTGLAFRDGTHELYSGSFDRTVKIWSLDDRAYVDTLYGHQSEVRHVHDTCWFFLTRVIAQPLSCLCSACLACNEPSFLSCSSRCRLA